MSDRSVALPACLDVIRVHAWRRTSWETSFPSLLSSIVVNIFDVEGMDMTRKVSEERQANVDKEI